MSKFSEFLKAQSNEEAEHEFIELDGSFGCQTCYVIVDEAKYYPLDKMLLWKCPDGHKSYAEEFVL